MAKRTKEGGGLDPSVILEGEEVLGMADAAKLMRGRGGRAPSVETVRRWANPKKGCHPAGKPGPQILLMTLRMNGEVLTCKRWVEAFERERLRLGSRQADGKG